MRKALLVLLVVAALVAAFYFGRHGLPTDMGHDEAESSTVVPSAKVARERLERKFGSDLLAGSGRAAAAAGPAGQVLELGADDLRDLAVTVLSEHENGRRLLASAKALEASVGDSTIEVGVVLNLSEIPEETLDPKERRVVSNARRMLPFLADRDLYLGLEGRPLARGGRLAFAADATVKLALFEFELASFARRLGLEDDVKEGLEVELPFTVRSVGVDGGVLRLGVED